MTAPRRHHAFTIMELIVAISIAGVMVLMINVLFQESVRAVNLGAGTSRVLQQSNTINTQLATDFGTNTGDVILRNSLLGAPDDNRNDGTDYAITDPNRVGFLMIAHHQIQNPPAVSGAHANMGYPVPGDIDESNEVFLRGGERRIAFFPDDSDGDGDADVRSDQLVFLRNLYDGERPITPQSDEALGNDIPVAAARIWYGHVVPTNDRGDDADDDPTSPDYDFYNRPANQWILGRQALYFTEPSRGIGSDPEGVNNNALVDPSDPTLDESIDTRLSVSRFPIVTATRRGLADLSGDVVTASPTTTASSEQLVYLNLARTDDFGDPVLNSDSPIAFADTRLYMALTDFVPAAANELFETLSNASSIPYTSFAPAGPLSNWTGVTDDAYALNAARIGYLDRRLWVNPRPHDASGNPARLIEAWQQAQMHPYLAAGVSDFEVHFAGDYDQDQSGTPYDGDIDVDGRGNILWYNASDPALNNVDTNGDGTDDIVAPQTKAAAGGDSGEVPIRRLPLPIGNPDHADLVFVWRHDEPQSWPDLIRIRYRIHDAAGRVSDRRLDTNSDGIPDDTLAVPGRLVEVIFRVPG